MKTYLSLLFMASLIFFSLNGKGNNNAIGEQTVEKEKTVQIFTSPDMTHLTGLWINDFEKNYPNTKVHLTETENNSDIPQGDIYISSQEQVNNLPWKMTIAHQIVVPVFNAQHPLAEKLRTRGVTAEEFSIIHSEETQWKSILQDGGNATVNMLVADNEEVFSKLADFTGLNPEAIKTNNLVSAAELVAAVQKDINTIGFCLLTDVLSLEENSFASQISILPIDKNQNGHIDGFENIFSNPAELTRGAWIGKYPKELYGDVYALAAGIPENEAGLEFLTWVINEGQEPLSAMGFSNLSSREKAAGMLTLSEPVILPEPVAAAPGFPAWGVLFLVALALVLVVAYLRFKRKQKTGIVSEDIAITPALNVQSVIAPAGLYYDKTHTWAFMEKDGQVKIGIDDFLQHITGPLTQIKMKAPGEKVRKGEKIFTITREGKQLEICSPVSGYIRQYNEELISEPEKLNTSPYSDGWVYQIEPANWLRETRFMFMADRFKEWLDDEFIRLKDFLANSANFNAVVFQHIVLQDGGELTDNVLADLGPEVWEDFQTHFLDTSK